MTIAPAPISVSGDLTTAASVPSGEKAGLKRSWVGSRATSLPHWKSVLTASTQMPYGKGEEPDVSVRTIREPSQPVSTTARAEASRALPSAFMTNRYGMKPEMPGLPGGLPTGAGLISGSSSIVATCAPSGETSAMTAVPPRASGPATSRPRPSSTWVNVERTTARREPSADAESHVCVPPPRVSLRLPVPSGATRQMSVPQR